MKRVGLCLIAGLMGAAVAWGEIPAGWVDAGEGFYYQTPVLGLGEGLLQGQAVVTVQIQNQSGRPAGEAVFLCTVYSVTGKTIRDISRTISGFAPGSSLIVDFPLGDIAPGDVGRAIVRTMRAIPSRPESTPAPTRTKATGKSP
jgi:hypothetical protein